jgi:hypothetical protein
VRIVSVVGGWIGRIRPGRFRGLAIVRLLQLLLLSDGGGEESRVASPGTLVIGWDEENGGGQDEDE